MAHKPEQIAIRRDFHGSPQVFLLSECEEFRLVLPTGQNAFRSLDEATVFATDALMAAEALYVIECLNALQNGFRNDVEHVFQLVTNVAEKHHALRNRHRALAINQDSK